MERKLFDFIKREFGREHNIERDNKRYMAALDFCRQLSFADPESLYNLMYYIYGGAIERPNINLKTIDDNIEKIDEILERNYGNIRDALKEVGVEND